jgi:hypothetical protein
MHALVAAVLLAQAAPPPTTAALLTEGDAHYDRRAEGARGAVALPAQIETAIASYRRALGQQDTPATRARLLRALFFRSAFCGAGDDEHARLAEELRTLAEAGLAALERGLPKRGTEQLAALRQVPAAIDLYFWSAAAWGEWAQTRSKLAAVRAGAAGRIRDLAQRVLDLDPAFEQGGGDRILGRLHDQCPHIPLLTGWVSHAQSVVHLRRALALGPQNTVNQFFLAEALLEHERSASAEARRLLETCARAAPRPEYQVEDTWYIGQAQKRLAGLGT